MKSFAISSTTLYISIAILIGVSFPQSNTQMVDTKESCNVRLTMNPPVLVEGQPVQFNCTHNPDCSYSKLWYIDDELQINGVKMYSADESNNNLATSTFDLISHRNYSGALLQCQLRRDGSLELVTTNVTMEVQYPPRHISITTGGSTACTKTCNRILSAGQTQNFTCHSLSSNPAYGFRWKITSVSNDTVQEEPMKGPRPVRQFAPDDGGWDAASEITLKVLPIHNGRNLVCSVLHPNNRTFGEITIVLRVVDQSFMVLIVISVAAVVTVLIVSCIITQFVKYTLLIRKTRRRRTDRTEPGASRCLQMEMSSLEKRSVSEAKAKEYAPPVDGSFSREQIKLLDVLGEGSFGVVYRARATGIMQRGKTDIVAVKMLKASVSTNDVTGFMKELDVCKTLQKHPHIIQLLGSCTDKETFCLIFEFAPHGNLLTFLTKRRKERRPALSSVPDPLSSELIMKFAWQIASGMEYLSSMQIIHRDLATRNILLGEDLTCKVSDFGFSRDVLFEDQYEMKSHGDVPVRWMAIESIVYAMYTTKSDVWSYGVLLWEIFTLGSHPYPGMEVKEVITALQDGLRLPKPSHCSDKLYNLMKSCWLADPSNRPNFYKLLEILEHMYSNASNFIKMSKFIPDHYD